jgi:predicted AAA+ superfamily ATPase
MREVDFMYIYFGDELKEHVENSLESIFKSRFILKDLDSYITTPNDRKVCCLYGLRRTGKTIMMLQEIKNISNYDTTLLLSCDGEETMWQVKEAIEVHRNCKFIFIDEITKARNFIGTCSFLADRYAIEGKKIVLSGTDSLGFFLAKNNELYDRAHLLHTTYISFKEYKYLLNKDIISYIKFGGTLTDGELIYNKDNLNEYSNTAIVYNIIHSLQKWNRGENYANQILSDIIDHNDLPSFITKVIEYHNRRFLVKMINSDFKSHDLGSLVELMTKSTSVNTDIIDTDSVCDRIRIYLGVKENPFNIVDTKAVNTIIQYLKDMDVLWQLPKTESEEEYIFTQPGMRYCQAEALAVALCESEEFQIYNDVEKDQILNKLKEDICGGILEDIVFYQTTLSAKEFNVTGDTIRVTKYRDVSDREIDVLVKNLSTRTSVAIEVKLSDKCVKDQCKHLNDEEFCKNIENATGTHIINKIVLYRGKTRFSEEFKIVYINVEEFLCKTQKYLESLLKKNIYNSVDFYKQFVYKGTAFTSLGTTNLF